MTDADTIANAEMLWRLVHRVQDAICKNGHPRRLDMCDADFERQNLADIRAIADELDPENGRHT